MEGSPNIVLQQIHHWYNGITNYLQFKSITNSNNSILLYLSKIPIGIQLTLSSMKLVLTY